MIKALQQFLVPLGVRIGEVSFGKEIFGGYFIVSDKTCFDYSPALTTKSHRLQFFLYIAKSKKDQISISRTISR